MILNRNRKNLLFLFVLFVSSLYLSGCNGREKGKVSSTINIALINDIDSFNPVISTDITAGAVQDLIYPALTSLNWNDSVGIAEYTPLMATNWMYDSIKNTITFKIRSGLVWSDGRKLGVDDVLYTFRLYADPAAASPRQFLFEELIKDKKGNIDWNRSFIKLSDSSFMLCFSRQVQNPLQLSLLKVVPDGYFGNDTKKLRENPNNFTPLSAGAYKLEKWEPNQTITLVKNEKFQLGNHSKIEKIVFKILPDYTTRLTALKTGEIDFMEGIKPEDADALVKSYPGINLLPLSGRNYEYVCWSNIDHDIYRKTKKVKPHPLFGDKGVRQALAMAIDRHEMIEGFLQGYGQLCNGPISPIFKWAYDSSIVPVNYDPSKALKILNSNGWIDRNNNGTLDKNGREFSFSIAINSGSPRREFAANMVRNYLKRIGIEVRIEKLEWNLFESKIIDRELDAFINGMAVSSDINPYEFWYSDFEKAPMNDPGYQSRIADSLIETASRLPRLESAQVWKKFQKILFDDQPCAFLYWYPNIIGYNKKFSNVQSNIWDSYNHISEWNVVSMN